MGSEQEPLLSAGPPPTYDSIVNTSYDVTFANSLPRRIPVIECRVCHATIDCSGRLHVSCSQHSTLSYTRVQYTLNKSEQQQHSAIIVATCNAL